MKLKQHSEYQRVYVDNQVAFVRCQEAIAQWRVRNEIIPVPEYGLHWTYSSACVFVRALAHLFQEYNEVIWKRFHYCRLCGGQCCVAGASEVRIFDLLAVALLERSAPLLPEDITARPRECIYLMERRCSWPDEWRPLKCWAFYCLGPGPWKPDATYSSLHGTIAGELQQVVRALLPDQLYHYEAVRKVTLTDTLDDPINFAYVLNDALVEIFVVPFDRVYPVLVVEGQGNRRQGCDSRWLDDDIATFIVEITNQVDEDPPVAPAELPISAQELLEDLDLLLWIIEGQPSDRARLLEGLSQRYAAAPLPRAGEDPSPWYRMRDLIGTLQQRG
jgi:hypothetical protein